MSTAIATEEAKDSKFSIEIKVTADGTCLRLSTDVKSLGITLHQHLRLKKQVSSILKYGYFHLRNISFISRYVDMDSTKLLVNSSVTSRLNYGNAILYGLPAKEINRLQRLQNCAARLVTKTKQHEH